MQVSTVEPGPINGDAVLTGKAHLKGFFESETDWQSFCSG